MRGPCAGCFRSRFPGLLLLVLLSFPLLHCGTDFHVYLPPGTIGPGPTVTLHRSGFQLTFINTFFCCEDSDGNELSRIELVENPLLHVEGGLLFPEAYGPGIDLELDTLEGSFQQLFHLSELPALPEGCEMLVFEEEIEFDPSMEVWAMGDSLMRLVPGDSLEVDNWISLRDRYLYDVFLFPAPVSWDITERDRAWMSYRIVLGAPGTATLSTLLPAEWLKAGRYWPVLVDPKVLYARPTDVMPSWSSFSVTPVTPGSRRVTLAATFYKPMGYGVEVSVDWGDGERVVYDTEFPITLQHDYPAGQDSFILHCQVSDLQDFSTRPGPGVCRARRLVDLSD